VHSPLPELDIHTWIVELSAIAQLWATGNRSPTAGCGTTVVPSVGVEKPIGP
jgi:hypothetical protein